MLFICICLSTTSIFRVWLFFHQFVSQQRLDSFGISVALLPNFDLCFWTFSLSPSVSLALRRDCPFRFLFALLLLVVIFFHHLLLLGFIWSHLSIRHRRATSNKKMRSQRLQLDFSLYLVIPFSQQSFCVGLAIQVALSSYS